MLPLPNECPLCKELREVVDRLQVDYRVLKETKTCTRCEATERSASAARGRQQREITRLKSDIDLLRRQHSESRDSIEDLTARLEERCGQDVNALLDQKDQEIKYLKRKLEEALGKRPEETQEEVKPDGTRFSLLEVD